MHIMIGLQGKIYVLAAIWDRRQNEDAAFIVGNSHRGNLDKNHTAIN